MNATPMQPSAHRADAEAAPKRGPWRMAFRIVRWSMHVVAAVSLMMGFHAVPPPGIATIPQAAARVAQKIDAVAQALARGQRPSPGLHGSSPMPQATLEAATQKMMDSPDNREKLKLPAQMSGIKIENGENVATYH